MASIKMIQTKKGIAHQIKYHIPGRKKPIYKYYSADISIEHVKLEKMRIELELRQAKLKHTDISIPIISENFTLLQTLDWYKKKRKNDMSEKCMKRYDLAWRNFMSIIGPDMKFSKIKNSHIEEFREKRLEGGATRKGINKDITHLKTIFKHARENDLIARDIKFPKYKNIVQNEPNIFTQEEIDRIIEALPTDELKLAGQILRYTGMRRSELALTFKKHYNLKEGYITIIGKNNTVRRCPIHKNLATFLQSSPAFQNKKENDKILDRHPDTLVHDIEDAKKIAGVNKKGACHGFRHGLGFFLINEGWDIRKVQEILGHKTLQMTMRYTTISQKKLKDEFGDLDF